MKYEEIIDLIEAEVEKSRKQHFWYFRPTHSALMRLWSAVLKKWVNETDNLTHQEQ